MSKKKRNLLIIVPLILVGVGIAAYFLLRSRPSDTIEVPLGVEEAVIITYISGTISASARTPMTQPTGTCWCRSLGSARRVMEFPKPRALAWW
jgi:hypothetical protein